MANIIDELFMLHNIMDALYDPKKHKVIQPPPVTQLSPVKIKSKHLPKKSITNQRDTLYFKLVNVMKNNTFNKRIMKFIQDNLRNDTTLDKEIIKHFTYNEILSASWWNITHSYIYYYENVFNVISEII